METTLSRRSILGATLAGATATLLPVRGADAVAPQPEPLDRECIAVTDTALNIVAAKDGRYPDLRRGANARWIGSPLEIVIAETPADVVAAVQRAVASGGRVAVRSGGHCYEGFVTAPDVTTVIDVRGLAEVEYDVDQQAFAVGAGLTLGEAYSMLYRRWGITIPGGTCPTVGVGGHVVGGGYGALSRRFGLTVDHLHGVEVVTVDAQGQAHLTIATRSDGGALGELWWAHTGGGGGNFGIVVRYLFRTPGTKGKPRHLQLPKAPSSLHLSTVAWSWDGLDRKRFGCLLQNFAEWFSANQDPATPQAALFSQLRPQHISAGGFQMTTQIDASVPGAADVLDRFLRAVDAGSGAPPVVLERRELPWLHAVTDWPGFTVADTTRRFKGKSAYMRRGFDPEQISAMYQSLTDTAYTNPAALVMLTGFGGAINRVGRADTAVWQRDSVVKINYINFWDEAEDDAVNLRWMRNLYRTVYAATGGVPVSGDRTDGCYVGYADVDLSDGALNTSGVTWSELYYGANYGRLQRVKAFWDPTRMFRHAQSVEAGA